MKKIILLVTLAILGVLSWYLWETRNKPDNELAVHPIVGSRYNEEFNKSINNVLNDYYALAEAFVNWDTARVGSSTESLKSSIDALEFSELQKDTVVYDNAENFKQTLSNDVNTISKANDITDKRHAFHSLSQNLYDLLRVIRYDAGIIYLQQCPMAFNDDQSAEWLSKTADIRNPYLGTQHLRYKSGMLKCGETKDSLNFAGR